VDEQKVSEAQLTALAVWDGKETEQLVSMIKYQLADI
jgi:hypothetical protein